MKKTRLFPAAAALALAAAFAVTATASTPTTAEAKGRGGYENSRVGAGFDAASSAIPTVARPTVHDAAQSTVRGPAAGTKAVSTAVATTNCDGCTGSATTFQTVYLDGRGTATADNVASAWTTGAGGGSSAVAVQLVVVQGAKSLVVNNRALALNLACAECSTSAAAFQIVVSGGTRGELSRQAQDLVKQIQEQLAERLSGEPAEPGPRASRLAAPEAKAAAEETAQKLRQLVVDDLGGTEVHVNVDVQTGR